SENFGSATRPPIGLGMGAFALAGCARGGIVWTAPQGAAAPFGERAVFGRMPDDIPAGDGADRHLPHAAPPGGWLSRSWSGSNSGSRTNSDNGPAPANTCNWYECDRGRLEIA